MNGDNVSTLETVAEFYNISLEGKLPIVIRGTSRWIEFPQLLHVLDFRVGAEIGVAEGAFSKAICKANPELEMFCIDPWIKYPEFYNSYNQVGLDDMYEGTVRRLSPYRCTILRKTSMEAVQEFEPNSLDFVYIDGNHDFEYVVNDIIQWSKIVRPGGIVSGHDYKSMRPGQRMPCHIIEAVNAYVNAYKIAPWFVIKADRAPSWFWVKP